MRCLQALGQLVCWKNQAEKRGEKNGGLQLPCDDADCQTCSPLRSLVSNKEESHRGPRGCWEA